MNRFTFKFGKSVLGFSAFDDACVALTECLGICGAHGAEHERFGHLVEVQLSGRNHLEHHFSKHYNSSESQTLGYEGGEEAEGGKKFTVKQTNESIRAESGFEFFDGVYGFRTRQKITNIGNSPLTLDYVSAFQLVGIDGGKGEWQDRVKVLIPHSYWRRECNWREYSMRALGLVPSPGWSSKRVAVSNTGTWSTKEYLPMAVIDTGDRLLYVGVEGTLDWGWEISTIDDGLYISVAGPSLQENGWQRELAPGESYTTPEVFVTAGGDIDELFSNVTDYRRASRMYDPEPFGVSAVFNDYMNCLDTDPSTEKELPLIERAQKLGCRYYMIDAGWYTDNNWWDETGEWKAAPTRFKGGLDYVLKEIVRHGMVPGLWAEIEVMSIGLPLAKKLPDDWFFLRNGKRVVDNSRYILNFANPEVRRFADEALDRMISEYGAGYIKFDHNVNGGTGTGDCYGLGLEEHWRGYLGWLTELRRRYPDVIFENCASGGMRMEYGLLRHLHLQSTSDQMNHTGYAAISANIATAVTPEQSGVWTYPVQGDDEETTAYNMVNAILHRVYQSGRSDLIGEECFALEAEAIKINGELKETIMRGHPFWPIGLADFDDKVMAFGLSGAQGKYLCLWNTGSDAEIRIPLGKYGIKGAEVIYPSSLTTDMEFTDGTLVVRPHTKTFARLIKLYGEKI